MLIEGAGKGLCGGGGGRMKDANGESVAEYCESGKARWELLLG